MNRIKKVLQHWIRSNHLWSILFLLAFALVTWMAIRTTLLTQKHQREFTDQQTRRALIQLIQVWEQGVDAQLDFWFSELNTHNPDTVERTWQERTPWLGGIYLWSNEEMLYPIETSFGSDECLDAIPEWIDCSLAPVEIQNRASVIKSTHWLKQADLSQAQFAILSARPRIQESIQDLDLTDAGQLDFIIRQIRLYQTEQLGAPINGGQALLGASLKHARQLAPDTLHQLLDELPTATNPDMATQIDRLQRHSKGWTAVQQIRQSNPINKNKSLFTTSSIASDILVVHSQLTDGQHLAITLDIPTLVDTFTNSNPNFQIFTIEPTDSQFTEDVIDVSGPKYFSHLRVAVPNLQSPDNISYQVFITLSPIILAGIFGLIGLVGSFRADRRQVEFIQRQQAFIARVTHELKTPLAGIKLMSESLQFGTDLSPESQIFVEKILTEAERLELRIDEILQVAKKATIGKPTRIDTEIFMLEIYDLWQPRFQEVHGTLRLELLAEEIVVDKNLLLDAISNLLSNAIKYRHPQKRLRCFFSMKIVGNHLEISVSDNGIGIPPQERKRVFDRFVRIEGNHRGFAGGHGLGLAFVAETAAAHNGTVRCLDGIDDGCKILMKLPMKSLKG